MDEVQKRKPWLTHKTPEPWAALVMSDNTRNFYGRSAGQVEERYMANVFGTFRAAVEEHLPVTVINDWNLNAGGPGEVQGADPAQHRLPGRRAGRRDRASSSATAAGWSPASTRRCSTSSATPRKNFALADVFGVDYRGLPDATPAAKEEIDVNFAKSIGPDYWEKRKNVFDFQQDPASFLNQGKMKTYVGDRAGDVQGPGRPRRA